MKTLIKIIYNENANSIFMNVNDVTAGTFHNAGLRLHPMDNSVSIWQESNMVFSFDPFNDEADIIEIEGNFYQQMQEDSSILVTFIDCEQFF